MFYVFFYKDFGVVYTCEARLTGSAWDEERLNKAVRVS